MVLGMNFDKALCATALTVAGLLALIFLLDLVLGIPFGRFSIVADILVVIAAGLIVWQGVETWMDFK